MDIAELKEILKNSTSVLIMENGEPSFVILDYKTYRSAVKSRESEVRITNAANSAPQNGKEPYDNGANHPAGGSREDDIELAERLNREILSLKHQIQMEEQRNGSPSA